MLKLTVRIELCQDVEVDSDIKWREGTLSVLRRNAPYLAYANARVTLAY